jgi:alkanesulfonate monooxygenase SsuD/methylene tetrahydromethanopterin reductase-like flavin-dependent oxidoreductase (luciferase family)
MADYGHELLFGTFLTPVASDADRVVDLAVLTDRVGLDLVTVQDHPYQPAFLDTWTLLSVIAARTERVRVSPNVANLPLRPPAVLARSVATLDILSGGRVELGLGAGAFWTAIAAMGGPDRGAAEGVDALAEAIPILRALWAPGGRGVRLAGEHYSLAGAKPGPVPAHDVEIWVGAYKRRMLTLTGQLADGWLPSLAYAGVDTLPRLNAIIDESAVASGRSPVDIRRLYNVPPGLLPEELAELTLVHGMSAFIMASDSAADIERFAAEVAPAVRELVAKERASGGSAVSDVDEVDVSTEDSERRFVVSTGGTVSVPAAPLDAAPLDAAPVVAAKRAVSRLGVRPTPDRGFRHTRSTVWDESARPVGPEPDPHRPFSAAETSRGQHLVDIHDHLRAELDQVRDVMEQVLAGVLDPGQARSHINTMTMRQNNWTLGTYCESYCRVVTTHHTLEDMSMLPQLGRADPRLAPVTDRLAAEHVLIHGVIEQVDRALVAFVADPGRGDDLRAAVDLLTDSLLSHLSYEERELVEPLARLPLRY